MNSPDLVRESEPGVFEFRVRLTTDLAKAALPVFLENLRVLDRKQQDYGSGNLTKFGVDGVVVRANDKLERIINLRKKGVTGGAPENESLADSFLDLANYALIGYLMQTAKWPVTTVPAPEPTKKEIWPRTSPGYIALPAGPQLALFLGTSKDANDPGVDWEAECIALAKLSP